MHLLLGAAFDTHLYLTMVIEYLDAAGKPKDEKREDKRKRKAINRTAKENANLVGMPSSCKYEYEHSITAIGCLAAPAT